MSRDGRILQLAVSPRTVTSVAPQMPLAVNGVPLALRQVVQWHRPTRAGWPRASIRMAPQLQLAVRVSGMIHLLRRWCCSQTLERVGITVFPARTFARNRTASTTLLGLTTGAPHMARRPENRGLQDRAWVNIHEEHEVRSVTAQAGNLYLVRPGSTNLPIGASKCIFGLCAVPRSNGNIPTTQFGRGAFQELYRQYQADFPSTVRTMCKHVFQPTRGEQVPLMVRQAWKMMVTGRPGPVVLDVTVRRRAGSARIERQYLVSLRRRPRGRGKGRRHAY